MDSKTVLAEDEIVDSNSLYKTSNYRQFKILPGSRVINKPHVRSLKRKIEKKNLNSEFPVFVNEKMEVVDGWHRITALEELELPVYYVIKPYLNSDDMIEINTGVRNWTWRNYAQSFAERGNNHYKVFLELAEDHRLPFTTLLMYCGVRNANAEKNMGNGAPRKFSAGDFELKNKEIAEQLLGQLDDVIDLTNDKSRPLATALYNFMRTERYDHLRMLEQIKKYGSSLNTCYVVSDYLYELERIYNLHK